MKITKFKFENNHTGWKLENTNFDPHLNLLVGASGVGKTKILDTIKTVFSVAIGWQKSVFFETKWQLSFDLDEVKHCEWTIEYSAKKGNNNGSEMPLIIAESLVINNEIIFERNNNATFFKGIPTLNINREESLIKAFKEEYPVNDVYAAFLIQPHSTNSNYSDYNQTFEIYAKTLGELAQNYDNIDNIRNYNSSIWLKLALLHSVDVKSFDNLKRLFIDIFPSVEDVKFDRARLSNQILLFFIKEKGVKKWISQGDISAGMFKTFTELGRIYLSPDNSIIFIDEFENSLGANCIDAVTESILQSNRNIQFIITSHHPYIINHVPIENWKIVSRDGGHVRTRKAQEYGISNSRLSAFLQLQQLDVFLTGSESIAI
jgi:predicted ATP-dependent endonuclease of OLD family